jgi:hypothetical protein
LNCLDKHKQRGSRRLHKFGYEILSNTAMLQTLQIFDLKISKIHTGGVRDTRAVRTMP